MSSILYRLFIGIISERFSFVGACKLIANLTPSSEATLSIFGTIPDVDKVIRLLDIAIPSPSDNIFNALKKTPYEKVKVVIIGQDPYHVKGQADGLAFSCANGTPQPSLTNIFKEIQADLNIKMSGNTNLESWAKQGVLLLNSVLTVESGKPNSHKGKGWEKITTKIVKLLNDREIPVIFMLWGANAKAFTKYITNSRHYILTAAHPSPLSANQGGWFGCKHFSKANKILKDINLKPIDWQIENI